MTNTNIQEQIDRIKSNWQQSGNLAAYIKWLHYEQPIHFFFWRFGLYQRPSSEEACSVLHPVLVTVGLWRGKKSVTCYFSGLFQRYNCHIQFIYFRTLRIGRHSCRQASGCQQCVFSAATKTRKWSVDAGINHPPPLPPPSFCMSMCDVAAWWSVQRVTWHSSPSPDVSLGISCPRPSP